MSLRLRRVLICSRDHVLWIVGNGPLDIGYVAYRRVETHACLAICRRAKREEVVDLLLMARLSSIQTGPSPVLRDGSFTSLLCVIVCEWMAHPTVSRGWSLCAEPMADTDHLGLCRGLIENGPTEVVGVSAFGLAAYGPHLHLAFLHARYYGLLVGAHALIGVGIGGGDHVSVQVSARVMATVG